MAMWIIISLLVLILILAVLCFVYTRSKKVPPDYYALFFMGIAWIVIGIPFENNGLLALGIVLAIVGIANKDKWKQNRRQWHGLTQKQRNTRLFLNIFVGVLVLATLFVLVMVKKGFF